MRAFEFQTTIQNGIIYLPVQYNSLSAKRTKVIVLFDDNEEQETIQKRKEHLIDLFKQMQKLNPFRNINNAVEWQKEQRDEWERCLIG